MYTVHRKWILGHGIEYPLQQHIQETDNKSVVISDSSLNLLHISNEYQKPEAHT